MIVLDVNVVLAAHRDDHPHHRVARPWFEHLLERREPFAVPDQVWAAFVRIATNRRIFEVPTPLDDAFAFPRAVRAQPAHVPVAPGERHLELFEELCVGYDAAGDLAADAYLAAITIEQGASLASFDRDHARFERLDWHIPDDGR